MWRETGGWGMEWVGLGLVHMLLFWGVVIFIVVLLVRLLSQGSGGSDKADRPERDALDILKERYARGEIDHEEFEERKKRLRE